VSGDVYRSRIEEGLRGRYLLYYENERFKRTNWNIMIDRILRIPYNAQRYDICFPRDILSEIERPYRIEFNKLYRYLSLLYLKKYYDYRSGDPKFGIMKNYLSYFIEELQATIKKDDNMMLFLVELCQNPINKAIIDYFLIVARERSGFIKRRSGICYQYSSIHANSLARIVQWISSSFSYWHPLKHTPSFSDWVSSSDYVFNINPEDLKIDPNPIDLMPFSFDLNKNSSCLISPYITEGKRKMELFIKPLNGPIYEHYRKDLISTNNIKMKATIPKKCS
jgi:hypothetical protein